MVISSAKTIWFTDKMVSVEQLKKKENNKKENLVVCY